MAAIWKRVLPPESAVTRWLGAPQAIALLLLLLALTLYFSVASETVSTGCDHVIQTSVGFPNHCGMRYNTCLIAFWFEDEVWACSLVAAASPVLNMSWELATAPVADMIKIIMLKNSIVYHHRREEEEGAEKKNEDAAASQIWRGAWVKELPLVHPKARLTHSSRPAVALWSYSSTSPPCSLNPRYFSWTQDICLLASENKRVATVWVILQQDYMPLFKAYNSGPWLGGSL